MSRIEGIPIVKNELPKMDIEKNILEKIPVEIVFDGGYYLSPSIARKTANHYAPKSVKNV